MEVGRPSGADRGRVAPGSMHHRARWLAARALAGLVALGLVPAVAPAAGASSRRPVRVILTKVRVRHGHPWYSGLRAGSHRSHGHRAHAAIVGGGLVKIEQAPWQVLVLGHISKTEVLICGGAILNAKEVLTAGHCVFNPNTNAPFRPSEIDVFAGAEDFKSEAPGQQRSLASKVRVHPYYVNNPEATEPSADDVAVLELQTPLVFNKTAKAIGLVQERSAPAEGTSVDLTGFGAENALTGELDGTLNAIGLTVGFSGVCGGKTDALFVCASTPAGSDCFGDSGSALTLPGSPPSLAGVTDTTQVINGKCFDGAMGGFANVAAPEIRDFIVGRAPAPPRAPRGGGASVHGVTTVGETLHCEPGTWTNSPAFTYTFINSSGGSTLQQSSSPAYPLTSADIGRTIRCQVLASNVGGTGVARSSTLAPVRPTPSEEIKTHEEEAAAVNRRHEQERAPLAANQGIAGFRLNARAPVPDVKLASTALGASASGVLTIKVSCPAGESSCSGTVTLSTPAAVSAGAGRVSRKKAVLTLASATFTVAGGEVTTVTLRLSARARALLARSHVLRVRATIVAHDPAGATRTTRALVTLRAAKPRHGKG
jgi:Trypsin